MKRGEVVEVLHGLASCLRQHPDQFNYRVQVSLTGVSVSASAPGATGLQATAVGGAGGTVIGANIQPSFGDVEIAFAVSQGEEAARSQVREAARLLDEMAEAVGNESKLRELFGRLASLSVPALISESVRILLRMAVGVAL